MKKSDKAFLCFISKVFIFNVVILFMVSLLFPSNIIFGNARLSFLAALILNGLFISLAFLVIDPLYQNFNLKIKSDVQWIFIHGIENILIFWILARFANLTGLGISSYFVAVFTGVALTIGQWLTVRNQPTAKKK